MGNKKSTWHILFMLRYDQKMLKHTALEMKVVQETMQERSGLIMKNLNTDFTSPKLVLWSLCILREHVKQTFKKHILPLRIL